MKTLRHYIIPTFHCELGTTLVPERVGERMSEVVSESVHWPWSRQPPFHGTVDGNRFRITYRKLDPGVVINGKVEPMPGGSRIFVSGGYGAGRFLFSVFCMTGLAWILWQVVQQGGGQFIGLWTTGVPVVGVLMHWYEIRTFWIDVEESLEVLRSEVGATFVSRSFY